MHRSGHVAGLSEAASSRIKGNELCRKKIRHDGRRIEEQMSGGGNGRLFPRVCPEISFFHDLTIRHVSRRIIEMRFNAFPFLIRHIGWIYMKVRLVISFAVNGIKSA
jgi:hypothetical protein